MRSVPTGRVKWYDAEKGFGFLSQEEGEDVYVRSSALPAGVDGLKAGQRVEDRDQLSAALQGALAATQAGKTSILNVVVTR